MASADDFINNPNYDAFLPSKKTSTEGAKPAQSTENRPNTFEFLGDLGNTIKNVSPNVGSVLADPAGAAALFGAYKGYQATGASLNPLNKNFMKYNYGTQNAPAPNSAFRVTNPVYDTPTGQASQAGTTAAENMFTNQVANKSFASAPEGTIKTLGESGIKGPTMGQLYSQTGPTKVIMLGGKPVEVPVSANMPEANIAPEVESTASNFAKYVPNAVKSALPMAGTVLKGAGTFGGLADIGARLYGNDPLGAGISAGGLAALSVLQPEIGIPISLGTAAINYLRDKYKK